MTIETTFKQSKKKVEEVTATNRWEIVGLMAAALSIASFLPAVIQVIVDRPSSTSQPVGLYWVTFVAQFVWILYAVPKHAWAVLISSLIMIVLQIIIISFIYTYNPTSSSSSATSS